MSDLISRQAAQHKINALIDEFETIMKDIRERHVDDSVCGLCEYDGAFMSDSGNWCNECPGFERDDCFKLKDQYREEWAGAIKNLPTVQPDHNAEVSKMEIIHCKDCKFYGRADKRRFYRGSDCLNKRIDTIVPDRDFCSRAERGNAE